MLFQQNKNRSKINEPQERSGKFIITSGNAPKLLDFLPKVLDEVALFIHPPIAFALFLVCFAAWNVWDRAEGFQPFGKILAVIAFVGIYNAGVDR